MVKALEEKNLIVPVVGNFAGPKALTAVGKYVREHGATIRAFYVSNVEQYLFMDGIFDAFARNVASLPVDASSTFIRSVSSRFGYRRPPARSGWAGQRPRSDPGVRPRFSRRQAAELLRRESPVQIAD